MNNSALPVAASPCINVCQMDAATGWCAGCLRTLDEIACWSTLDEPRRHAVLAALPQRLELWLDQRPAPPSPQPSCTPTSGTKT